MLLGISLILFWCNKLSEIFKHEFLKALFSFLYNPGAINLHICIAINGNEKNKAKKKAIFNSVKKASCKAV